MAQMMTQVMTLPHGSQPISEAERLALERDADMKHEFSAGRVTAMVGASRAHNVICTNIARLIGNQLVDKPCEIYQSDMRVAVKSATAYRYPDVAIVCDEPQFTDQKPDTLLNPTVLIEMLSPNTLSIDRSDKLWEYREISSLQAYLLVAQDTPRIELVVRQSDDTWLLSAMLGIQATLAIQTIGCTLKLQDVYAKVEFDNQESI